MCPFIALLEHVSGPPAKLIEPLHDVAALVLVVVEDQRGKRRQLACGPELFLDLSVKATGCQPPTTEDGDERCLESRAAEAGNKAMEDVRREVASV